MLACKELKKDNTVYLDPILFIDDCIWKYVMMVIFKSAAGPLAESVTFNIECWYIILPIDFIESM